MAASRTIVIAGAGIAGLTTGLALAQRGLRAFILEQAERLQETGAGLQLTPNATRVLIDLGLGPALRKVAVAPEAIRVRNAHTGDDIIRMPMGDAIERRHGAPYWVMLRSDLQSALLAEADEQPDVAIELGARVMTFASHANGVTVKAMRGLTSVDATGMAFVGADGLWSNVRRELGDTEPPRFAKRVAWRAVVPAAMAPADMRAPLISLWLARRAHLVHYPVQAGRLINIVAIASDGWTAENWSTDAAPAEVMARFPSGTWSRHARDLLGIPARWQKWALQERPLPRPWGAELVTLVGDAAHTSLPFLAQGAGLAIEDAAVLAARLSESPERPEHALRRFEAERRSRVARVLRAARRNGKIYHYYGPDAAVRNLVMRALGGERLLSNYAWIYDWRLAEQRAESAAEA
jgi:salicylate hydroxylase